MATPPARGARPPSYRQMLLLAIGMGATFYLMINYAGPFRWLAELQLRWLGYYEETITFLVTCMLMVVPLLGLDWLMRRTTDENAAGKNHAPAWTSALAKLGFGGIIAGIGLFLLGLAGWQYLKGRDETMTRVSVEEFEAGRAPQTHWVAVEGIADFEAAGSMTESSSSGATYYVPVISPEWKDRSPVALFIEARENKLTDSLRRGRFDWYEGMLSRGGLPGMVQAEFERTGPRPAKDYYTLELNKKPADLRRVGRDLSFIGGGFFIAGAITILVQRRNDAARLQVVPSLAPGMPDPRFEIKTIKTPPQQNP